MNTRIPIVATFVAALVACVGEQADDPTKRGDQADVRRLQVEERAAIYATALRSAFELPGTALLVDARTLPMAGGYDTTESLLPGPLILALERTRTVRGRCTPEGGTPSRAPACPHPVAGYAIRFSDIFGAGNDTVRVNLTAVRYRPETDMLGYHPPFAMEERYHLAGQGQRWRVARKERMRL